MKLCTNNPQEIWQKILQEANSVAQQEPLLAPLIAECIFKHESLTGALSTILSEKLASQSISKAHLNAMIQRCYQADPLIIDCAINDLVAIEQRDPAVNDLLTPLLYFKGFHSLQAYRIAHYFWQHSRTHLALFLQSQITLQFSVDIHPAAKLGHGIMLDHATGIVIGETAEVENDVSILQSVTLGGTGKECGDRHPKVREGVMIGAGAKVLGNIEIGRCSKIGAGSVVLHPVPANTTVAGVPAKIIGSCNCKKPALDMDQNFSDNE